MATTTTKINTNIRLDSKLRQEVDAIAKTMGLSFSTVVNLLLRKFILEKNIELSVSDDTMPYYNDSNSIEVNEPIEKVIDFLEKETKKE